MEKNTMGVLWFGRNTLIKMFNKVITLIENIN
ncbi:hypothetical protein CLPUN_48590 [Clostridium puniceum]|uniref:Uncharacterized protein n=1 Tax=Clostridium puniceum TaxID=29367 RepID=A0A1S8T308_9CLOT|nr:hypothetical protein CLPUN_48590 [Clostridium puniceum]